MADLEFYKLSMTGAEADSGIRSGMEAGATSGVLLGDGNGGVTAATPGRDFGFPLLTGNGPPTGNTAANIGQHYFDMQATQAPYEYICVGLNANGFIWVVYGDTGDGFKISGYFESLEALEAAISAGTVAAPTVGTAYGIGAAAPYDIYVWDAVNNTWVNNGPLGTSGGGSGVPPHGTTGQVLTKLSDRDGDAGWEDIARKGEGAPTVTTVGMIGQLYIDTTATENPAYICVGITTADNVTTYVWQPVGGTIEDGSIGTAQLANGAVTLPKIASSAFDSSPAVGSDKLITSGGVAEALANFTGGVEMVKLWENASPTSSFLPQTITIDLNLYSAFRVVYAFNVSGNIRFIAEHIPNTASAAYYILFNDLSNNTGQELTISRRLESSTSYIAYSNCYYKIENNTANVDNNRAVPLTIYGIKEVA